MVEEGGSGKAAHCSTQGPSQSGKGYEGDDNEGRNCLIESGDDDDDLILIFTQKKAILGRPRIENDNPGNPIGDSYSRLCLWRKSGEKIWFAQ